MRCPHQLSLKWLSFSWSIHQLNRTMVLFPNFPSSILPPGHSSKMTFCSFFVILFIWVRKLRCIQVKWCTLSYKTAGQNKGQAESDRLVFWPHLKRLWENSRLMKKGSQSRCNIPVSLLVIRSMSQCPSALVQVNLILLNNMAPQHKSSLDLS